MCLTLMFTEQVVVYRCLLVAPSSRSTRRPVHARTVSCETLPTVHIMKLLTMQFYPPSCHLIPLSSNIFLSTFFSNILNLCSSFNVRDQVSNPYNRTGYITVLYIWIYTFVDIRADKIFLTSR
jgi:hypothetical protein